MTIANDKLRGLLQFQLRTIVEELTVLEEKRFNASKRLLSSVALVEEYNIQQWSLYGQYYLVAVDRCGVEYMLSVRQPYQTEFIVRREKDTIRFIDRGDVAELWVHRPAPATKRNKYSPRRHSNCQWLLNKGKCEYDDSSLLDAQKLLHGDIFRNIIAYVDGDD